MSVTTEPTIVPVVDVGNGPVSIQDIVDVARHGRGVRLTPTAFTEIARCRRRIENLAARPAPVYGVSTGFGALATRYIPAHLRIQLQRSVIRSHAAGAERSSPPPSAPSGAAMIAAVGPPQPQIGAPPRHFRASRRFDGVESRPALQSVLDNLSIPVYTCTRCDPAHNISKLWAPPRKCPAARRGRRRRTAS
jgi:hypothetical protein